MTFRSPGSVQLVHSHDFGQVHAALSLPEFFQRLNLLHIRQRPHSMLTAFIRHIYVPLVCKDTRPTRVAIILYTLRKVRHLPRTTIIAPALTNSSSLHLTPFTSLNPHRASSALLCLQHLTTLNTQHPNSNFTPSYFSYPLTRHSPFPSPDPTTITITLLSHPLLISSPQKGKDSQSVHP